MSKALSVKVKEQRDQCKQRIKDLRVEVAEKQEKIRELAQRQQELNQQTVLLAHEMKGEEITLERLKDLAGED